MTLYSRDAAERLLAIATKATNIVETDSAHLAQLAETIIELYDRLSAPPRIIRTREELAALDPDTLLRGRYEGDDWQQHVADLKCCDVMWRPWVEYALPAVVIATGDQARAARQALEEA